MGVNPVGSVSGLLHHPLEVVLMPGVLAGAGTLEQEVWCDNTDREIADVLGSIVKATVASPWRSGRV